MSVIILLLVSDTSVGMSLVLPRHYLIPLIPPSLPFTNLPLVTFLSHSSFSSSNCVDYDLCESCEENSQFLHYDDHVFLKMRRPLQYAGLNRKGKRKPLLKRNIYHPMILPFNPNPL